MVRGLTFLIKEEKGVLTCSFVFTYAKSRFSDNAAYIQSWYSNSLYVRTELCRVFICFYRLTGFSDFTVTLIFVMSLSTIRRCPFSMT